LSIPLNLAFFHINKFLDKYPSEVIVLEIRPDYSPINADNIIFGNKHETSIVRLVNRENKDLLAYTIE